jgi:Flp pilus assembly pilin Flp
VKRTHRSRRRQSGAALAEYGLLVAGITLASLVAVSVLGSKVGGLVSSVAMLLPGTTASLSAPVQVGELVQTITTDANGDGNVEIVIDSQEMLHDRATRPRSDIAQSLGLDPAEAGHLAQIGDTSMHGQ